MAYTDNEYRYQVRGAVGGSESWYNTWTVRDTVGLQDPAPADDAIREFYNDITGFASWLSDEYTVVGAQRRRLSNDFVEELSGFSFVGSSSAEKIPTQLAMRVSLQGGPGSRGGPFLTGFVITAIADGLIDTACVSDFAGAFNTMQDSLLAEGFTICVDRPSLETTDDVIAARIGRRFDVIRKRSNDTPESYTPLSVT